MTADPTAGNGPTPSGGPTPSAQTPGGRAAEPEGAPSGERGAAPSAHHAPPPPSSSPESSAPRTAPGQPHAEQAHTGYPDAPQPGSAQPAPGSRRPAGSGFFDSIRRTGLYRTEQRWIGGVASGVAVRLGWDPLLVRGLLVLSFFLGGIGLVVYAVGWALLPEQSDGRIHLEEAIRGNFDVAVLGAAVLLLVGFAWGGPWQWGFYGDSEWIAAVFWLAVIGGIVYLLVKAAQKRPSTKDAPHAQPYPVPPAAGQPSPGSTTPAAAQPYGSVTTPVAPPHAGGGGPVPAGTGSGGPPARPGSGPAYQGPHYPVAPYVAQGGAAGPQPAAGPPVHTPPRPRPPKGGGGGIVVGLILLVGAALLLNRVVLGGVVPFLPSGPGEGVLGTWIGLSLVIVGVAIVVAGLRGRSSGGLGALAIIGLIIGVPWGVVMMSEPYVSDGVQTGRQVMEEVFDGRVDGYEPGVPITEGTISPGTIAEAERGYSIAWGDPVIDLTGLDLSEVDAGDPVEVPIALGAGSADVIIPKDAAVELEGKVSAGVLEWNVDGLGQSFSGYDGTSFEVATEEADDGATLRLVVDAAAGEVIIEEEQ